MKAAKAIPMTVPESSPSMIMLWLLLPLELLPSCEDVSISPSPSSFSLLPSVFVSISLTVGSLSIGSAKSIEL